MKMLKVRYFKLKGKLLIKIYPKTSICPLIKKQKSLLRLSRNIFKIANMNLVLEIYKAMPIQI
jgi:hypothetical protein